MTTSRLLWAALLIPLAASIPMPFDAQLRQHQQSICSGDRHATAYTYNSVISGFTNISKTMHFTAHFKLICDRFDDETGISHYTVTFSRLATKIKNSVPATTDQNSDRRRRKMPRGFQSSEEKIAAERMTVTASTTTTTTSSPSSIEFVDTKTVHSNPQAQAKENIWYDMPAWPVKFVQHLNGTILEIFIKSEDFHSKSEVSNLKKSIVLLFLTSRDRSAGSVVETDDLGTHFSEYAYKVSSNGETLLIHKQVSPDDFLRLQLDQLNAEKLEIFVNQYQRVRNGNWLTESVSGRVATYPIEASPTGDHSPNSRNLPFSVEVNYSLSLTGDSIPVSSYIAPTDDEVSAPPGFNRLPSSNFTSQEYDSSDLLVKILSKKEETLRKKQGGISGIVETIAKAPHNSMKEANLLRSIIGLESKVYLLKGKNATQPLLEEILPIVRSKLRQQAAKAEWDSALKMLYILSSGVGFEIDNLFAELLNDTDLMDSSFRPQFLNTLIQFEHPTDRLVEVMLEMLPSTDSMSITEHHISLAISSLVAKETDGISRDMRIKVVKWFQQMVAPLQQCPPPQDVYKIFLESIANFLSTDRILKIGQPADELVAILINVVKSCRKTELAVEALNSLRNCFTLESVQVAIAEALRADDTPCTMRGGMVDALVIAMELASSNGVSRSWPRYGIVHNIDDFILTEWLDAPASTGAFSCSKQPIARYLVKKKGREWYQFLLSYLHQHGNGIDEEELRPLTENGNNSVAFTHGLVRKRRDDMAAANNPLAGLGGGLAGGLGGFVFTPEVDCDNWNSQVGVNYTEIYENPIEFDNDVRHFSTQKRHCLFRAEFKAALLSGGLKAGFFAGRNERGESKLFGRAWMGVRLLVQMEIAVVQFLREQTQKGFQGHVLLRALSNVYLHEVQYACNLTINDWTYGWQYTTPAFRVTFGGFAFLMNADFDIRFNLTLWPSFCGPDGAMGIRFRPITIVEADAYAELENDFFGLGSLATLYLNYYLDTQMSVPSGCFYLYHGNDDMFFKFDFYLKLPSFVFINFEPSPVVLKQPFPVLTWQLMIKKSSRYVLLGWCLPNTFQGPETPRWEIE